MKLTKTLAKWFGRTSAAEKRLLQRCRGDQAQMDRLVAHELQSRPGLSRAQASDRALERWTRDR